MTSELWTVSGASRACSLDRATIRTRLAGIPPDGRLGRYDAWQSSTVLAAIRRAGEVEPGELDAEREKAGLLRAQRLKVEFENAVAAGRYLDAAEVEAADAVIFTALRDRIRAVSSIAPLLVQAALDGGELAVKRALVDALDAALEELGTTEVVAAPKGTLPS